MKQLKGFSSLMNNSVSYWNFTIEDIGEKFCNCGSDAVNDNENKNEKEDGNNNIQTKQIDELFTDKRTLKNKDHFVILENPNRKDFFNIYILIYSPFVLF